MHYVSRDLIFMQNLKSVGATVIEIREFNRMEEKTNMKNLCVFTNIAHILHQIFDRG